MHEFLALPIRSAMPASTLTFLFTDIEGSTRLRQAQPEGYLRSLAQHNQLMRQAIEAQGGHVFKLIGDAFCTAFATAPAGLRAALEAQRALHQAHWGEAPLRVRMALHSGAAELRDGEYEGFTLARMARLLSAGHGGQVLLSQAAVDLVQDEIPAGISLRDMGERRLKDLVRPEHIYQLVAPDLPDTFPALKTLDAYPNNLPVQVTSFIGRDREMAEAAKWLSATRLLSLIGPGGTGKTRLALHLAAEQLSQFKDGVWLMELAPLGAAAYVVPTLAATFGLREAPGVPLLNLVIDYLRAKRVLLILDNCEHLVEICAQLASQLLQACPSLKIIASSREALGIPGETVYLVPSLSLPEHTVSAETLMASEAARLFVERALQVEPRFKLTDHNTSAIAQICRHLDGIPLALELAAARIKLFTPEQIAQRLDDRFRLLTGGSRTALPRQQTLRAMIDWSFQTLNATEQSVLRGLAVFAGGWTFEAAEAVVGEVEVLEGLAGLVNKSLVNIEEQEDQSRYRFLETIRQYALEKLVESGQATEARHRHLDYFLDTADESDPAIFQPERPERLDQLEVEHDNLRAALDWATEQQPAKALKLAEVLSSFWGTRGYHPEARAWCEKILARTEGLPALESARANVYGTLGWIAALQGDHQAGRAASEAGLRLARQINDSKTIARALHSLAFASLYLGDYPTASQAAAESEAIARQKGYTAELAMVLATCAQIAYMVSRDLVTVRHYLEESVALAQATNFQWALSFSVYWLARMAGASGDLQTARRRFEEAANLGLRMGNRQIYVASRSELAHVLREHGELDEPLAIYRDVIQGWRQFGHRAAVAHELECIAYILRRKGQALGAAKLLAAAEALRQAIASAMTQMERAEYEQEVAALRGQLDEAALRMVWSEGHGLTMDEAITLAINDSADSSGVPQ